jgi:hypothetical protein
VHHLQKHAGRGGHAGADDGREEHVLALIRRQRELLGRRERERAEVVTLDTGPTPGELRGVVVTSDNTGERKNRHRRPRWCMCTG